MDAFCRHQSGWYWSRAAIRAVPPWRGGGADYYAELPIARPGSGRYHDIGAFAADVANLSRIVTLHDLSIAGVQREGGGSLSMDAVARTYRYLDANEVAAQKKPAAGAKK